MRNYNYYAKYKDLLGVVIARFPSREARTQWIELKAKPVVCSDGSVREDLSEDWDEISGQDFKKYFRPAYDAPNANWSRYRLTKRINPTTEETAEAELLEI